LGRILGTGAAYVLLIAGALVLLSPAAWMVSTSLKSQDQLYQDPKAWIPKPFMWENYRIAWFEKGHFTLYLRNSLLIAICNVIGQVLSSALVAYAFARLRWPGREVLFVICISTMMLPGQVTMIPIFVMFTEIGWMDTFLPLIVPGFFGVPFFIFLLRQFFRGIPIELDEAAIVDGATTWGILWKILLPLSKPALASCAIFAFIWHWNNFLQPLLYLRSRELHTLQLGLMHFQRAAGPEWNYLMAASTLIMLPCLAIFFFAQRWFIHGISFSGLKG
jgi:multiple sugar transport system permease protein